jgi:ketosteroid isomerase-like protein
VTTPDPVADAVTRYFDADEHRDTDAVVALFVDDAVVVDEGQTWQGISMIRAWRQGPASKYDYKTEVFDTKISGDNEYVVTGKLEGNFPGGTADLTWRFTLAGDRIRQLTIR